MSAQPSEDIRPAELDEATIVAWARHTRAAKGLPAKVEDPATLRRIAVLAFGIGPPSGSAVDAKSEGPGALRRSLRYPSAPPKKVVAS